MAMPALPLFTTLKELSLNTHSEELLTPNSNYTVHYKNIKKYSNQI